MSPVIVWDNLPEDAWPCPNACGGLTNDAAGGPCSACWDKIAPGVDYTADEDDGPNPATLRPGEPPTKVHTIHLPGDGQ
jgi:hypothetical protein